MEKIQTLFEKIWTERKRYEKDIDQFYKGKTEMQYNLSSVRSDCQGSRVGRYKLMVHGGKLTYAQV